MTIYPIEFHRRLEQKWASRIDQIHTASNATPPRDPNDDDDYEDEDEEDEEDEEEEDEEDEEQPGGLEQNRLQQLALIPDKPLVRRS
jgi:hypothetical protein